ncbi:MAG: hypothetical protein AAGH15_24200 [Myxococcota bacterium]
MSIKLSTVLLVLSIACAGTAQEPRQVATTGVVASGSLDARSFEITLAREGEEPWGDTLAVTAGSFASLACAEYGFGPATYTTDDEGDALAFRSTTTSDTEGTAVWRGRARGETLEGTMVWTRPGEAPLTYTFRGTAL